MPLQLGALAAGKFYVGASPVSAVYLGSMLVYTAVAPEITGVPTISGTAEVGQTLTATAASVTGTPTPARTWQWERNGAAISGATAATYALVTADAGTNITVVQTETNVAGFDIAESTAVSVAGGFAISSLYEAGAYHWDTSDTSTLTEVSGEITQVRDKTGNGNHLNFSVAGKRPALTTWNGVQALDARPDKYGVHTVNANSTGTAHEEFWAVWSDRPGVSDNAFLATVGGATTTRREVQIRKLTYGSGTTLLGVAGNFGPTLRRTVIQHVSLNAAGTTQTMSNDGRTLSGTTAVTTPATGLGFAATATGTTAANAIIGERFVINRELTLTERANVTAYLTNKWRALTPVTKYHIVLLTGQSNMRGSYGPINRTDDATNPRIAMLERTYNPTTGVVIEDANGPIVLAEHPLSNRWRDVASPPADDSVGMGMAYAKALLATLPSNEGVLLVPCAQGSTFAMASTPLSPDVTWHPSPTGGRSNAPYLDTIARANRMVAAGHQLHTILWCQGESDAAVAGTTQASHAANMDAILGGLRSNITGATNTKMVIVDIGEFLNIATYVKKSEVKAAIADTPNRLTKCAFVSSVGMTDGGDSLHYNAASQRTLGAAAWTAFGTIP